MELIDRELQSATGLPLPWFDVLARLAGTPDGRMPMKQLAESVLMSKSGVTRLVDRMVDAGLIARESCRTDGRVVYAVITRKGRLLFNKAAPVAYGGVERHYSRHISPEEAKAMSLALGRILESAEAHGCRLCAKPPARTRVS